MFVLKFLVKWTRVDKSKLFLSYLLTFSIFSMVDLALSLYLTTIVGVAPLMLLFLVSNFILYVSLKHAMVSLNHKIAEYYMKGIYPEKYFNQLCALYITAPLLLAPGFLSTGLAFILFGPARMVFGTYLKVKMNIDWKDLYEYLKMEDFDY